MKCTLYKNGILKDESKLPKGLEEVWDWTIEIQKGVTFDSIMRCMLKNRESSQILLKSITTFNPIHIADEWINLKDSISPYPQGTDDYLDFLKVRWVSEEFDESRTPLIEVYAIALGVESEEDADITKYIGSYSPARLQGLPIRLENTIRFYEDVRPPQSHKMILKTRDLFSAIVREITFDGDPFLRNIKRIKFERMMRELRESINHPL
jgi:hypothetical protein